MSLNQQARRDQNIPRETDGPSSPEDDRTMNYRSFADTAEDRISSSQKYRGFSTSINDIFSNPENERVDCCALACCGVLQSDRDRYLLTGLEPPSCFKRFWIHLVLPIVMFLAACWCAMKIGHPFFNSVLSTTFLFSLIGYFILQCFKGALKRRQVRKELLWSRYHIIESGEEHLPDSRDEDSNDEQPSGRNRAFLMGQTLSDIKKAHAPCAFYASDQQQDDVVDFNKMGLCAKIFQCYTNVFCGKLCGMHLQLCGVCGIAQEAREVEAMIDPGDRRIDYITMQPMLEYYPAIYEARTNEEPSTTWWDRLSKFSKSLLSGCGTFVLLLFVWSFCSSFFRHKFGPQNFFVFCLTVFQALFLLALVFWKHTKDISIDAIIKLFACGFCLSTTLAVSFELLVGVVLRIIMSLLMAMSGIDVVEDQGYSDSLLLVVMPGFGNSWLEVQESGSGTESYREFLEVFGRDHPFIYTIYLLIRSFLLAAMIEELAKYFGYRMVEHPDFLTKRELEETAASYYDDDNEEGRQTQDAPNFSHQDRSKQSRGAAITVAMVAVGLGFACCENLVYVFVYSEATFATEILVLLVRSMFPIHPISAALQSIRVCEREVENNTKMKLGSIILPAVLFHGSYDFLLMWIEFMVKRRGNFVAGNDETENADAISLIISMCILGGGLGYYYRESKKQRERLVAMDQEISVDQSRLI